MPWIVFVLASVFLYSISNLLQKVLMKDDRSDPYTYSIVFQLLGSALLFLYAVLHGFVMPPVSTYPLNFLLLAALYGTGSVLLFNALKHIEASELTIITSFRSIVTIAAAMLFLGETFSLQRGIGTMLILASIFLITDKVGRVKLNKGFFYALGMAICFGLAVTNDAFLIKHAEVYSYAAVGFFLPGIFLLIMNPKKILKVSEVLQPKIFPRMLLMTAIYVSAALSFYLAISVGAPVSQATPMLQSSVIVTVLLAALFLHERSKLPQKIIGALLVIIGVVLLS